MRSSSPARRDSLERLAAWLYTGPLGHLYGVLADIAEMGARYGARRLRERLQD